MWMTWEIDFESGVLLFETEPRTTAAFEDDRWVRLSRWPQPLNSTQLPSLPRFRAKPPRLQAGCNAESHEGVLRFAQLNRPKCSCFLERPHCHSHNVWSFYPIDSHGQTKVWITSNFILRNADDSITSVGSTVANVLYECYSCASVPFEHVADVCMGHRSNRKRTADVKILDSLSGYVEPGVCFMWVLHWVCAEPRVCDRNCSYYWADLVLVVLRCSMYLLAPPIRTFA